MPRAREKRLDIAFQLRSDLADGNANAIGGSVEPRSLECRPRLRGDVRPLFVTARERERGRDLQIEARRGPVGEPAIDDQVVERCVNLGLLGLHRRDRAQHAARPRLHDQGGEVMAGITGLRWVPPPPAT